jgi:putative ABC transport system permease protein
VLLNTSGAFLRSFQRMQAVNPGFRPDHVLVAGYQLPLTQYSTRVSADNFNHAVIDKLSTRPGIVAVGIGSSIPAAGGFGETGYTVEDEPAANWKLKFAAFATTYGEYFRALDVPLVDGRYFTKQDLSNHPPVVIVSQSMARHSGPGQRAIGRRMHAGSPEKKLPWATVLELWPIPNSVLAMNPASTSGTCPRSSRPFSMVLNLAQNSPIRQANTLPYVQLCLPRR